MCDKPVFKIFLLESLKKTLVRIFKENIIHISGLYHLVPHTFKIGFVAPVFKKDGNPAQYLYSHHHEGRLWLLGQSYTSWSIRLDLVSKFKVQLFPKIESSLLPTYRVKIMSPQFIISLK